MAAYDENKKKLFEYKGRFSTDGAKGYGKQEQLVAGNVFKFAGDHQSAYCSNASSSHVGRPPSDRGPPLVALPQIQHLLFRKAFVISAHQHVAHDACM